jgi:regulation of enolase protein 1 (concanavalin A-like superfamily)
VAPVTLFDNKKPVMVQPFAVVKNNTRTVEFEYRINEPGKHELYIGDTQSVVVQAEGEIPAVVYESISINEERLLAGQTLHIAATAKNIRQTPQKIDVKLFINNQETKSKTIELKSGESQEVSFDMIPDIGRHSVRIGNSAELTLTVLKSKKLDLTKQKLYTHITERAKPAKFDFSQQKGVYSISAAGTDFFQGEDSYAAIYLKQLKGDFVATVKLASFGGPTNQWFRSGLFVRNDISHSFEVVHGSKGAVLMFSTPGRAGIHFDEFGNGCMHKAASENLPEDTQMPLWIRLERHGDSFSGAISLDGKNWIIYRKTGPLPGVTEGIDVGLAAGAPDKKQYTVNFTDWEIVVEDQ